MRIVSCFLVVLGLAGCEPPAPSDLRPPRLLSTEVSDDGKELALDFDETVESAETGIEESPAPPVIEGSQVRVPLPAGLKPGKGHVFTAEVVDPDHNVTSVAGKFYPVNPRPAGLRLNEVRVAGSGVHTDLIELRVEAAGSLGGWTVEVWATPENRQRLILPDEEVEVGTLILIRYKPAQEVSDTLGGAREFWQPEGKGLPGTKGLLLLRQRPDGPGTDALLYSSKSGEGGVLAAAAGWKGTDELDPTGCTATRTWCRTDEPNPQWIVAATGGATPGAPNKLTPWEGPTSTRGVSPKSKSQTKGRKTRGSARRSRPWSNATEEERGAAEAHTPADRKGRGGRRPKSPGHRLRKERVHRLESAIRPTPPHPPVPPEPRDQGGEGERLHPPFRPKRRPPAGTAPAARLRLAAATPCA